MESVTQSYTLHKIYNYDDLHFYNIAVESVAYSKSNRLVKLVCCDTKNLCRGSIFVKGIFTINYITFYCAQHFDSISHVGHCRHIKIAHIYGNYLDYSMSCYTICT